MIPINRVYRTVQRILNIEERGQLPADDFNHIGALAQNDLFNRMFYDKPHFMLNPKGGDIEMHIQHMIDIFVVIGAQATLNGNIWELPSNLYKIKDVYYEGTTGGPKIVEQADHDGWNYVLQSKLTCPTTTFPKYRRIENTTVPRIQVWPTSITTGVTLDYVKTPAFPEWDGMDVVGGNILYDPMGSTDFELHPALEQDLIHRILFYAGVSIRQQDIVQAMQYIAGFDQQIEKS